MQSAAVRGVKLVYEVLGSSGPSSKPWVTISPGGRRGLASDRALGVLLAEAGFRVLVYDRRNTGASEIGFPGDSESHEQAEDLLALRRHPLVAQRRAHLAREARKTLRHVAALAARPAGWWGAPSLAPPRCPARPPRTQGVPCR